MKTRLILFFMLTPVFLSGFSGCDIIPGNDGQGEKPEPSIQGKDGLVMQFFDNAPPERLIADFGGGAENNVSIGVLIENRGAFNLNCEKEDCGYFFIDGGKYVNVTPEDTYATRTLKSALDSSKAGNVIRGRLSQRSGGRVAIETSALLEDLEKTTSATIFANICYPYKTFLSSSVCVETAHYSVQNKVCNPDPLVFSSQGAPVAITRIEQDSIIQGNLIKPRLKIFIRNIGGGFVIKEGDENLKGACTPGGNTQDIIGKVTIEEANLSGKLLDCKSKSVSLTGPNTFVQCTLKEKGEGFSREDTDNNLVSPLRITLSYGYQTVESKTVEIEVLDEKPRLTRVRSSKTTVSKDGETIDIVAVATDDNGVGTIWIKGTDTDDPDCEGKQKCYDCEGKQRCEHTFKDISTAGKGPVAEYIITVKDTAGRTAQKKLLIKVGFCNDFKDDKDEGKVCANSCSEVLGSGEESGPDAEPEEWVPDEDGYECRDKWQVCCVIKPSEEEEGSENGAPPEGDKPNAGEQSEPGIRVPDGE